jgi:cytochrome c556
MPFDAVLLTLVPPACVAAVPADANVPTVRGVLMRSALKSVGNAAVVELPIESKF